MNQPNLPRTPLRRLALMGSVAGVALAVVLGGPSFRQASFSAFSNPVQAAETNLQHPADFADLIAHVKPAVISVRVKMTESSSDDGSDNSQMQKFFQQFGRQFGQEFGQDFGQQFGQPQRRSVTGEGSGFFISADGYAVTNNHVVDHATTVTVTTDDGKTHTAKVVGTDPRSDLALIKVDGSNFPYVKFSDHPPRIGEWAVAVGNPFGLGGTVTAGIVSATGRDIGSANDYIQIDAPINRGNSGGPTFDTDGNVMGINTAIFSPSGGSVGIGFDIPAATAKNVIAQLKENGHVTRGYLGVQIQPVTSEMADALGLKQTKGALVAEPQSGSPAAKAGVKSGDVIVSVDGKDVKDARELSQKIATMSPGTSVELGIIRDGKDQTINVTLAQMQNERQAQADTGEQDHATPHLGLSLAPARETGANREGVVVTAVDPNGPAADHGIQAGDVILNVGGAAVSTPNDVRKQLAEVQKSGKHEVLMRVKSDNGTRYVALPLAAG
ncbi:MAG TPA: Do family serine endopeptidase [Xanthobacteraceae bacterium]|jgi:serine protease Do|nr:Do family serine endopeptidase [Xanthobacteraceae bacterium]